MKRLYFVRLALTLSLASSMHAQAPEREKPLKNT